MTPARIWFEELRCSTSDGEDIGLLTRVQLDAGKSAMARVAEWLEEMGDHYTAARVRDRMNRPGMPLHLICGDDEEELAAPELSGVRTFKAPEVEYV